MSTTTTTIGILGGGQLGRMLALAAARLGLRTRCYDESPEAVAGDCAELIVGSYTDLDRLARFEAGLDVATYEFENVPAPLAEHLARRVPTFPAPSALALCQDRLEEKTLFHRLGIGTARFAPVSTRDDLERAVTDLGLPAVLKTRRFGYDGKGQAVLRSRDDLPRAWTLLGEGSVPLILESCVPVDREHANHALPGRPRQTALYTRVENTHVAGILRLSVAPAPRSSPALQSQAQVHAARALDALDYVGVLAIEFFEVRGELLANEMAPRVHNSGHWTMDGALTCQFENHIRAVTGLPLGECRARGHAAMLNLIGAAPPLAALAALPGAHLHLYGKSPRPGRKLGHINVVEDSESALARSIAAARTLIEPAAC
ncbi:MAG: 5-(carboxyamino)imidazole ribonucleotide synthase [Phycisphaerales bacterium]